MSLLYKKLQYIQRGLYPPFYAVIRNPHTRRAYVRAVTEFLDWCSVAVGVPSIIDVEPLHVAAWIEGKTRQVSAPTVKQHLAAIRHLFDWLVTGQIVPVNPAASVRGPSHVVKTGKTPILDGEDARRLLASIDISTQAGLRDRALVALMVYSFARIGAAVGMKVEDVYTQNRRLWVRLREKGGKRHEMPCHHNLEDYLVAYIDGTGLRDDPKGFLFRTIGRGTGQLTASPPRLGKRPCNDPASHGGGGYRNQGRKPQFPSNRHHGLSQEWRQPGKSRCHGQPRQHAHDTALRPPPR